MTTRHHPRDLFELLCAQAAGQPIPAPPAIAGRVFVQRMDPKDTTDDFAEAWTQRQEGGHWLAHRSAGPTF